MKEKIFNTEIILIFLKQNNLSKNAFCKLCKINPSVLNKILNQQTNFRTLSVFKIARVMNIHVKELFIKKEKTEN